MKTNSLCNFLIIFGISTNKAAEIKVHKKEFFRKNDANLMTRV